MYYEFYIDVYFLENLFMDLILIGITSKVLKIRPKAVRWIFAAIVGALGACALMVQPLHNKMPVIVLGDVALGILMVKIGCGIRQNKMLLKGVMTLYLVSFLMGGIFQMLFSFLPLSVIVTGGISSLILLWLLDGYRKMRCRIQDIYQVTLSLNGKTEVMQALRDTGNHLKEPYGGRPVCITDSLSVKELVDDSVRIFYIPYHSVGKDAGILPGITFDYMIIAREPVPVRIEHPVIAISKEPVSVKGEYQMILNPLLIDE